MEERIFKMTNDGVFLNSLDVIPYSKTNLPIQWFAFVNEVYWKVAVNKIKKDRKEILEIFVVDYSCIRLDAFFKQKISGEVTFLLFKPFEYNKIIYQVACQKSGLMRSLCKDYHLGSKNPIDSNTTGSSEESYFSTQKKLERRKIINIDISTPPTKNITTQSITLKYNLENTSIKDGYLEFNTTLKGLVGEQNITISNNILKKEYNLLKKYFCNKLRKNTFEINIEIVFSAGETIINATSQDIDKIDETFIDAIRHLQIKSLANIEVINSDQKLYTVEKFFNQIDKEAENVFGNTIEDIINVLTDYHQHRNSPQIIYLAKSHDTDLEKVRITLKPIFGFVFYLGDSSRHHYIWELLNSHATYIWSYHTAEFPQAEAFDLVELAINEIYNDGRNPYKEKHREDVNFKTVEHKLIEGSKQVLFEKWKDAIDTLIQA